MRGRALPAARVRAATRAWRRPGKGLRFSTTPQGAGGSVSLTIRRYCAPGAARTGAGMRSARDRGPPVSCLAALPHRAPPRSRSRCSCTARARGAPGTSPPRACAGPSSFKRVSTLLRPIQGGVDRVALGLLVRARGKRPGEGALAGGRQRTHARSPRDPRRRADLRRRRGLRAARPASPRPLDRWHVLEDLEHARTVHCGPAPEREAAADGGLGQQPDGIRSGQIQVLHLRPDHRRLEGTRRHPRTSSAPGTSSSPTATC